MHLKCLLGRAGETLAKNSTIIKYVHLIWFSHGNYNIYQNISFDVNNKKDSRQLLEKVYRI